MITGIIVCACLFSWVSVGFMAAIVDIAFTAWTVGIVNRPNEDLTFGMLLGPIAVVYVFFNVTGYLLNEYVWTLLNKKLRERRNRNNDH